MSNSQARARYSAHLSGLVRRFESLLSNLNEGIVTDIKVQSLLRGLNKCESHNAQGLTVDLGPDFSNFNNHRLYWRNCLVTLTREASWLHPETKVAIETFIESIPETITASGYEITADCFTSRIPQFQSILSHFSGVPNLRFLEIGSFEGYSAAWTLKHILCHETSRLYCIDPFVNKHAERRFDANIRRAEASDRLHKCVGTSVEILPTLPSDSFEFIYVDGSHDQASVLTDAVVSWRTLKIAGIMLFDDYGLRSLPLYNILLHGQRPDVAIDAFLKVFERRCRVIYKGYQLAIEKIS